MSKKTVVRIVCAVLIGVMVLGLIPAVALAATPSTLYFKPSSNWKEANARFAAYFFGNGNTWVSMTDSDGDGIYECAAPAGYPSVIFCRMNPSSTTNDWNNKWNQTADLTIPTDGKNCFTGTAGAWDSDSGSWSTIVVETGCDHVMDFGSTTTAATCTTAGVTTYSCTLCDYTKTETIPALGHKYQDGVCVTCGASESDNTMTIYFQNNWMWSNIHIHYWGSASVADTSWPGVSMDLVGNDGDYDIYKITLPTDLTGIVINGTKDDGAGALDQTPDITSGWYNGICYYMKWDNANAVGTEDIKNIINLCEHSYSEEITTAATCEAAGVKTFTCSKCDDSYTEAIPALGHNYADGICGNCGQKEPCTNHTWDNGAITTAATCTKDGVKTFTCTNCDATKTEAIAAIGHNYADGVCGNCGMVEECDVHSWDEGVVITPNSCWMPGTKLVTCTKCGATQEQMIYAGHDLYDAEISREPTCTATGNQKRRCTRCTAVYDKTLPALGHDHAAGQVVAPTCTEDGYTVYTCSRCGTSENRDLVDRTGHNWNGNTCTVCGATCAHTLVDGICSNCAYGGPAYVNGYYEIANAAQLKWFANQVNSGNNAINGKLVADIDLKNATWTAIGAYCPGGDSSASLFYRGNFDGNGHVVANFTVAGDDSVGLFGYAEIGTIKNLGVINATATGANAGAVIGYASTATVINCFAINCTITGYTTNSIALTSRRVYVGAVAGQGSGYVYNCFALNCKLIDKTGDMYIPANETYRPWHEFYSAPVGGNGSSISNNYYCGVSGTFYSTAGATEVTSAQMASGEVAYKLQSKQTDAVWGQTIGTDSYPVIFGDTVYFEDGVYFNKAAGHEHDYEAVVTAPTCGAGGYTTYTCSACGYSYVGNEVAATGAHNYTYSFANNKHTLTCSICGDVISAAGTNELKFRNATLSLASDISVIFKLDIDDVFEVGYMVFEVNGEETYVYDYTIDESNGRKVFAYQGINPQMMGDSINCTIHAYLNGTEVTVSYNGYSVVKYCNSQFGKTDATVKQVCANLLNYGAAVQLKKGYKTDALVNANLPVAPETFPGVDAITNQQAMSGAAIGTTDLKSVALQLSNKVEIKVGMVLDNPADYVIKVTIKGNEFTYGESDLEFDEASGRYYLYFSNLNARDFDETITFVILKDGVEVSRTLTYSVNSYIARNGGAETADGNTLRALYCYGKSTESLSTVG